MSMRKKIPYLEEKIIKKNYLSLEFVGGCLWSRQNVSKWDDIEKCSLIVNKEVIKYDYKKMGKIKHFDWTMTYSVPYEDQIKKQKRLLRKSQYYEVEVDQEQIHFLMPLIYDKKENTLIVIEDLVEYPNLISNLAFKLDGLKKIRFQFGSLGGGFLDLVDDDGSEYIRKKLGNKKWSDWILDIKSEMIDANQSKYEVNLDINYLLDLRKNLDSKIKIEFDLSDKKEKKILKDYGII